MPRWPERTIWERFWSKVDASGGADACWPWTGALSKKRNGKGGIPTFRGLFQVGGRTPGRKKSQSTGRFVLAHRFALCLVQGGLDLTELLAAYDERCADGSYRDACHSPSCNNRLCCNPTHVYWGSKEQNVADRILAAVRDVPGHALEGDRVA